MIINIIRGISVYGFFISLLFLILNYFVSKVIKNDFSVLLSFIISIIVIFSKITVIWD